MVTSSAWLRHGTFVKTFKYSDRTITFISLSVGIYNGKAVPLVNLAVSCQLPIR